MKQTKMIDLNLNS